MSISYQASLIPVLALAFGAPASGQWSTADLSEGRWQPASGATSEWALFAGGVTCPTYPFAGCASGVVDAYHRPTGLWSVARPLANPRYFLAGTSVNDKVLFGGGWQQQNGSPQAAVDVYDASAGLPSDPAAWSLATLSQARGCRKGQAILNPHILCHP